MKKNYLLLLLTIISIPAFADRGELYAWHELNNTGGESILSFIFHSILLLLIGIPALFFGLCGIFKGERIKESFKLGCFGFCVILFLYSVLLFVIYLHKLNDIIHTAFKDNLIFTLQVDGTNYNMRKLFIIIITIISCLSIHAREPFGDYICRYIVTYDSKTNARTYHPIYNPLKITHQGIRVKNTQQGTKIWAAKYQGPIRLISSAETERFHNFYLTNQKVEFSISDRQFVPYNGKQYYMIIFDGQVQLAEPVY